MDRYSAMLSGMVDILGPIWGTLADFFRSRAYLQTEFIALRHRLNVLRRKRPERLAFDNTDRLLFVWWPKQPAYEVCEV